MSHVEGFPDRDGIDKIVKLGKKLCGIIQAVTPLLLIKYPDNETIQGLIGAINGVCALLPNVENEFLIETGTNEDPLENPAEIAGINPDAEQSYPPDYTP